MRTHGWAGSAPASDEEAVARVLAAAGEVIDAHGVDFTIADVARKVGVTRQTVYRYFPSTDALLTAAATQASAGFLDRLAAHVAGLTDPADAAVESIATTLEWLPEDNRLGLLLSPDRAKTFGADVTSDVAVGFARTLLSRFEVDWDAVGLADDLDEMAEYLLRIIQSFVVDPGRPPRHGAELRAYLRRWVAPALGRR
ncbi:MAG: helix-turn-helix domain containing protein [Mycobacterium sp.]|nr:helix-turn-helix domain containing protein [Mycobacterium sp.]